MCPRIPILLPPSPSLHPSQWPPFSNRAGVYKGELDPRGIPNGIGELVWPDGARYCNLNPFSSLSLSSFLSLSLLFSFFLFSRLLSFSNLRRNSLFIPHYYLMHCLFPFVSLSLLLTHTHKGTPAIGSLGEDRAQGPIFGRMGIHTKVSLSLSCFFSLTLSHLHFFKRYVE